MASVPGIVYVSVGALVTVVSLLMGDKFKLFFYVGLAFLTFGGAVSFIGAMQYHGAKKTAQKHQRAAQREIAQKYPQYAQQYGIAPGQQMQRAQQGYKTCSRCRTAARPTDNFCGRCGSRV